MQSIGADEHSRQLCKPAHAPHDLNARRGLPRHPTRRPDGRSVGDTYDDALAETINGPSKAEVIHRRSPWRSFEAVEFATLECVDWFNTRRLLESIGNISPAEAEARYYA